MRWKNYKRAVISLVWLVVPTIAFAQQPADWREQNAYTLGVQAYLYSFPWAYMPDARWTRTEAIDRQVNRFHHIRKLEDASHLNGGAPNNDTLYSRAWLYVKDEPVILTVPEISDRYYTMEIVDFMGDNFAYVGTRATGTKAGDYAIVGPGWTGTLPAGVKQLPPSSTPWVTILGRTFVKDEADLKNVFAIQDQYKLTRLSEWGKSATSQPKGAEIWKPLDPKTEPLAEWKTINRAMVEVPPAANDADLIQSFARIGVGPGLDVDAQDPATKRGLARAAVDGKKIIAEAFAGPTCKSRSMAGIILRPLPGGRRRAETGYSAPCRCSRALSPTIPSRHLLKRVLGRRRQTFVRRQSLRDPFREGRPTQG